MSASSALLGFSMTTSSSWHIDDVKELIVKQEEKYINRALL
jgi:hypothetical protein